MSESTIIAGIEVEKLGEEIVITPRALQEIGAIRQSNNIVDTMGLRMGVKGGGCSGFTYALAFDNLRDGDKVLEFDGLRVFVDPKSYQFIQGTTLDYDTSLVSKGFIFNNPNAKSSCGCGTSFSV